MISMEQGSESLKKSVYLDANATLPLLPQAREAIIAALQQPLGNPSSPHAAGRAARLLLEEARAAVRLLVSAEGERVVLTASGSESNQLALLAMATDSETPGQIIYSAGEHPSVRRAVERLSGMGWSPREIPLDSFGRVEIEEFRVACQPGDIAAMQWANAETGAVNHMERLGKIAEKRGVRLHVDAVQAIGKVEVRFQLPGVVTMSLSAHKIGGPQGIGALVVRKGQTLVPLFAGGSQEGGIRPGTEAVLLAAGFAAAARHVAETGGEWQKVRMIRDQLIGTLKEILPRIRFNGPLDGSDTGNCLSLTLPGEDAGLLALSLDLEGFMVSRGPACLSGAAEPSATLLALGLSRDDAMSTLRISLWPGVQSADCESFCEQLRILCESVEP